MKYIRVLKEDANAWSCMNCAFKNDTAACESADCIELDAAGKLIDYYFIEETEVPQ
jgi:hypothetical protein